MKLKFTVIGYDKPPVGPQGLMEMGTQMALYAKDKKDALKIGKQLDPGRKYYYVRDITQIEEHVHVDQWAKFPFEKLNKLLSK